MKKIIFLIAFAMFVFVACGKDDEPTYTFTVTTDGGGSVTPTSITATEGTNCVFTVEPNDGMCINTITLGSTPFTAFDKNDSKVTIPMPGKNVTVHFTFEQKPTEIDYSKLKINEVSGVGGDSEKFYELINIGDEPINLLGCQIFYNANASNGGVFPPNGNQGLTWTGKSSHTIQPGALLLLLGRYNATNFPQGEFTTGLTAQRILIITLKDPNGNVIDECIRAKDTGEYDISDKSFSRVPDGTGSFYFTEPTPNIFNGGNTSGLLLVPATP